MTHASSQADPTHRPTCLVLQGYGRRTDPRTGVVRDLDRTFQRLLRPAVEQAGWECRRVDASRGEGNHILRSVVHELVKADAVIADVSLADESTSYLLGVCHALRPTGTLVVQEMGDHAPIVDISQLRVLRYDDPEGEDPSEQERFSSQLGTILSELSDAAIDSPVYSALPDLRPGTLDTALDEEPEAGASFRDRLDEALRAREEGDWAKAEATLRELVRERPQDESLVRDLALAVYKQGKLDETIELLTPLDVGTTRDASLLHLWATAHRRRWDEHADSDDLNEAIWAYRRGFELDPEEVSGTNAALLLLALAARPDTEDPVGNRSEARTLYQHEAESARKRFAELTAGSTEPDREALYWTVAAGWEAAVALGDEKAERRWEKEAHRLEPHDWMIEATTARLDTLRELVADLPTERESA